MTMLSCARAFIAAAWFPPNKLLTTADIEADVAGLAMSVLGLATSVPAGLATSELGLATSELGLATSALGLATAVRPVLGLDEMIVIACGLLSVVVARFCLVGAKEVVGTKEIIYFN